LQVEQACVSRVEHEREREGLDRSAENKFERAPVNCVRGVIIAH